MNESLVAWPMCTVIGCTHRHTWASSEIFEAVQRLASDRVSHVARWVSDVDPHVGNAVCTCHSAQAARDRGVVEQFPCDEGRAA